MQVPRLSAFGDSLPHRQRGIGWCNIGVRHLPMSDRDGCGDALPPHC